MFEAYPTKIKQNSYVNIIEKGDLLPPHTPNIKVLNPRLEGFGIILDFHQSNKIRILSCLNKLFETIFPNGPAFSRYCCWKAGPFVCLPEIWLYACALFLKSFY